MSNSKKKRGRGLWSGRRSEDSEKPGNPDGISPLLRRKGAGELPVPDPENKVNRPRKRRRDDSSSNIIKDAEGKPLFPAPDTAKPQQPRRKHRKPHTTAPLFNIPEQQEQPRRKVRIGRNLMNSINSTIIYLLAFIIVYLLYQLTVIFTASQFGISGVLYYYQIFWPIGNSSPLWFPSFKIILITGSGPFICLIAGLLFFRIFAPQARNPIAKLFFLWIALHALNMFFGAFVAGVTTNDGFGYVALWLHMNIVFRILFSLIFLFTLASFGHYATKMFLETAQSPLSLKAEHRREFLFFQVLLPGVFGAIIITLVRIPVNPPYFTILLFTIMAATITAFLNRKAKPGHVRYFPKHHGRKLQFLYLLPMVAFMVAFRLGLEQGLHFIIRMSVSISVFGAPD